MRLRSIPRPSRMLTSRPIWPRWVKPGRTVTQNGSSGPSKEEAVDLPEYLDYHDAYRQLGRFLDDVYMRKRIHSSLGYLTPAEFEEQWRKEQELVLELN